MAKNSYVYFCSECGYESSKWMGQCPACKSWNTFVEEAIRKGVKETEDIYQQAWDRYYSK